MINSELICGAGNGALCFHDAPILKRDFMCAHKVVSLATHVLIILCTLKERYLIY